MANFWSFCHIFAHHANSPLTLLLNNIQKPKVFKQTFELRERTMKFSLARMQLPSLQVHCDAVQGTLTLILKGEVSVGLTSSSLLVRIRLFWKGKKNPSFSWCRRFLPSKYKEVSRIDTSPFRIKVSPDMPWPSELFLAAGVPNVSCAWCYEAF